MSTRPRKTQPKSLMRNIGEFFGHIVEGVKSSPVGGNPSRPAPSAEVPAPSASQRVVREHVQEQEVETPQGKVVLRRRIIDEVEPPRPAGGLGERDERGQKQPSG